MTKILVVAEHHDGKLNAATAKTVSAAAAISGASIDVVVLAADPTAAAAEAAQLAGVAKVLTVANAANAQALAQVLARRSRSWPPATPTCSAPRPPSARTSCRAWPPCWASTRSPTS